MARSIKWLDFGGIIIWRKSTIYWVIFKHISHLVSKIILWVKHCYSNVRVDGVGESKQLAQVHTATELLSWHLNLGLYDATALSTESHGQLLIMDPAYFWNIEGNV